MVHLSRNRCGTQACAPSMGPVVPGVAWVPAGAGAAVRGRAPIAIQPQRGDRMTTVSDFVLQRLHAWGVRRIFGYPGDGINGLMGAMGRQDAIEFVQTRHEELAAFMATAH